MAETIDETQQGAPKRLSLSSGAFGLSAVSGRQLAVLVTVVFGVAVLVATGLWLSAEPYRVLFTDQTEQSLAEVMSRLDTLTVDYKIDEVTGAVKVPASEVHRVRLQLAGEGLPRGFTGGFELLDKEQSFGTSEFMERARYQRALEGELARSIMTIGKVRRARVHLALSKQSLFVRDRKPQSASVLVELYPGHVLEPVQVQAITNLVSASVPKLTAEQVTVVDQMGILLTRQSSETGFEVSSDQLEFTTKLESRYARRVEEILTPIVGFGNVRARISVDADFSTTEETEEIFDDSGKPRVRSEQLSRERSAKGRAAGIPGALSNQAPEPSRLGDLGDEANDEAAESTPAPPKPPAFDRSETLRNYEIDKRVRHTRYAPGAVKRITAAVVVADQVVVNDDGDTIVEPYSAEQLERITNLVQEAIGYDAERGDRVTVISESFAESPFETLEGREVWWKSDWFLNLVRLAVVAILVIVVAAMVIRPAMRTLVVRAERALPPGSEPASLPGPEVQSGAGEIAALDAGGDAKLQDDLVRLSTTAPQPPSIDPPTDLNTRVELVKDLIADDPQRAVQVVKQWVTNDV